ncbi:MAG: hypothetical protein H6853_06415 [Rhodospirillales bacterium]|nr:hypothetical protein [Alphaproteobacteria bacterium]USO03166.1 MAG: hypothetical protein H6853_06415 [Rhodospirillales bacterium]
MGTGLFPLTAQFNMGSDPKPELCLKTVWGIDDQKEAVRFTINEQGSFSGLDYLTRKGNYQDCLKTAIEAHTQNKPFADYSHLKPKTFLGL